MFVFPPSKSISSLCGAAIKTDDDVNKTRNKNNAENCNKRSRELRVCSVKQVL